MTARHDSSKKTMWLVYALSVLCVLAVWHIAAVSMHAPLILPVPLAVAKRLGALCKTAVFWQNVGATFVRVLKSVAIVCVAGAALGVLCGVSKRVRAFVAFPLAVIRSTPVVSFILLALFWLGTDTVPVFCAVLMALPVMITAVTAGFENLDGTVLEMAQVFRFSRKQIVRYIYVDELTSFFASGALSSFGMIWKVVAAGEVLSVPRSAVGTLLQGAQVHLETADVLALSIALVAMSVACEGLFRALVRVALRPRRQNYAVSAPATFLPIASVPAPVTVNHFSHQWEKTPLFADFSLAAQVGERLAVLAPSGAGKTTLLRHIAFCGDVRVSYAFQEPRLLNHCTLLQNVMLPLLQTMDVDAAQNRARYMLQKMGLGARLFSYPAELSGGEKQRLSLARALAFPAPVLLLDEAFQSQDVHIKQDMIAWLKELLSAEPRTVILVTHDPREAMQFATRVVVLGGKPVQVVLDELARATDEKKMVDALKTTAL